MLNSIEWRLVFTKTAAACQHLINGEITVVIVAAVVVVVKGFNNV